jgi:hypothetical protein
MAAAAALAGCVGRSPPPPWMRSAEKPRDENYHGGNAGALLKYDGNKDGTLTRGELIAGLKAAFAAHDTHHNGCLDADQTAAINQERVETDQSTATPIVDWNQDGCIDYTEFSAAPYSLFDQMDINRDGKITPQEFGKKPKPDDETKPDAGTQPPAEPGGQHRRGRRGGPEGPPGGGQ